MLQALSAVCVCLLLAACSVTTSSVGPIPDPPATPIQAISAQQPLSSAAIPVEDVGEGIRDLVQLAKPAVVRIELTSGYYGSGVIFATQGNTGFILTNQHVIDGSASINVTVDDAAAFRATVVGADATRDLAVLSICCRTFRSLAFADAGLLQAGDEVVAMGYPLGLAGSATVTRGIVSAVRYDSHRVADVIQTDAAINPGNSGGPLLSLDGHILGITTYGYETASDGRSVEGVSFAISERTIRTQLSALGYRGVLTEGPTPSPPPPGPTATAASRPTSTPLPTPTPIGTPISVTPEVQEWSLELAAAISPAYVSLGRVFDQFEVEIAAITADQSKSPYGRLLAFLNQHERIAAQTIQELEALPAPTAETEGWQRDFIELLWLSIDGSQMIFDGGRDGSRGIFAAGVRTWSTVWQQHLELSERLRWLLG